MMLGLHPGERALVISAHPEDAAFGMGGTIAALAVRGITVDVLAVTDQTCVMRGVAVGAEARQREFGDACDVLGVQGRQIGWTGDGAVGRPATGLPGLVTLITQGPGPSLAVTRPAALFIPTCGHHQDHQAAHRAALAAIRQWAHGNQPDPRLVFGYDDQAEGIWISENTARPAVVDITGTTLVKRQALDCYTQICADPHPRSLPKIQAMDQAAGAAVRSEAAERFAVYRIVL